MRWAGAARDLAGPGKVFFFRRWAPCVVFFSGNVRPTTISEGPPNCPRAQNPSGPRRKVFSFQTASFSFRLKTRETRAPRGKVPCCDSGPFSYTFHRSGPEFFKKCGLHRATESFHVLTTQIISFFSNNNHLERMRCTFILPSFTLSLRRLELSFFGWLPPQVFLNFPAPYGCKERSLHSLLPLSRTPPSHFVLPSASFWGFFFPPCEGIRKILLWPRRKTFRSGPEVFGASAAGLFRRGPRKCFLFPWRSAKKPPAQGYLGTFPGLLASLRPATAFRSPLPGLPSVYPLQPSAASAPMQRKSGTGLPMAKKIPRFKWPGVPQFPLGRLARATNLPPRP